MINVKLKISSFRDNTIINGNSHLQGELEEYTITIVLYFYSRIYVVYRVLK